VPALLREYARDPVLGMTPPAARRLGDVQQTRACKFLDKEDITTTAATLHLQLSRNYDEVALRQVYDPVATGHGWKADVWAESNPQPSGAASLIYCRTVSGTTSELTVAANPNPGAGIVITIEAATHRPNCATARPVSGN